MSRPDSGPVTAAALPIWLTDFFTRHSSLAVKLEQSPQDALDNMQAELEDLYARNA